MTDALTQSVWAAAMQAIGKAGDRLATAVEARGRGVDHAHVYRTVLGALMDAYLTRIAVDVRHPSFVPCTGYFQRLGSPNPDTVYRSAPIDPKGVYRLTGERGTARDVTLMPFSATMRGSTPLDLISVARGPDGAFDVTLSAERPASHDGEWWQLHPDTVSLWLREVSTRWGEERAARIAITRLDPGDHKRPSQEALDAQLAALAVRVERIVEYGILHVDELSADGYINRLKQVDYSASGAMPLQFYHEGVFDLAEGDCLLVEARMSPDCNYFSWSLTDAMLVTLDWTNAETSLNSAQAAPDPDGVLRVVVSKTDPGTSNWMNTLGYRYGVLQCRSTGSPIAPVITAELVPAAKIFDRLPSGMTRIGADGRLARLRERQRSWQMRHLW